MNRELARIASGDLHKIFLGWDHLANQLEHRFANATLNGNYPPYNVAKIGDDKYVLAIAVTGFNKEEVEIQVEGDQLTITATCKDDDTEDIEYLHRGLALRNFQRSFTLAEYMEVKDAVIENGVLTIEVVREVPEAKKPRQIAIK